MARPMRDGVDYFPLDVGIFRDTKLKLIKGEFGALGILVYMYLLSSIYEDNGYYKEWSDDVCILVSEDVGCGCSFSTVAEIVKGCVRRSLFDERVLDVFGVLTSAGVQRRFIRAASKRDDICMIQEYCLLNVSEKKDVPPSILNKLAFKSIQTPDNVVKTPGNTNKTPDNPQRKVKQSKGKESKGEKSNLPLAPCLGENDVLSNFVPELRLAVTDWLSYKTEKRQTYKPTGFKSLCTEIANHADAYGADAVIGIIRQSMANNWQGIAFDRLKDAKMRETSKTGPIHQGREKNERLSFSELIRREQDG